MDKVFIVIEGDSNDESRILRVFTDESKALAFKLDMLNSHCYDYVWVEEWDVWK